MAEFLGDLAVVTSVALGVWGLLLIHRGRVAEPAALLRWGGGIAVVVGFGGALCAATYMFIYRSHGDFDRAYPITTCETSAGVKSD